MVKFKITVQLETNLRSGLRGGAWKKLKRARDKSVIRPVLFLAYINDLPNRLQSQVRLFADDTVSLYGSIQFY